MYLEANSPAQQPYEPFDSSSLGGSPSAATDPSDNIDDQDLLIDLTQTEDFDEASLASIPSGVPFEI